MKYGGRKVEGWRGERRKKEREGLLSFFNIFLLPFDYILYCCVSCPSLLCCFTLSSLFPTTFQFSIPTFPIHILLRPLFLFSPHAQIHTSNHTFHRICQDFPLTSIHPLNPPNPLKVQPWPLTFNPARPSNRPLIFQDELPIRRTHSSGRLSCLSHNKTHTHTQKCSGCFHSNETITLIAVVVMTEVIE